MNPSAQPATPASDEVDHTAGLSPEVIEGRLLAHRNVLAAIIGALHRQDGAPELMAALDALSVMQDHQEDPGAVIGGAVAIEGALAAEITAVMRAAVPNQNPVGEHR